MKEKSKTKNNKVKKLIKSKIKNNKNELLPENDTVWVRADENISDIFSIK